MSTTDLSRRTIAKGAAWTVPAVAVGSAAPALAGSTPQQCVAVDTTGCWSCDFDKYNLMVAWYSTSTVSAQTSLTLSVPSGTTVPAGTTFTFTYKVYRPVGAAVSGFDLNGEFGGSNWGSWTISQGTWTATTYNGQASEERTTTVKVKLAGDITGATALCGGIQFLMALTEGQTGGYSLVSVSSDNTTVPVCSNTTGHMFTNGADSSSLQTANAAAPYNADSWCSSASGSVWTA